MAGLAGFLIGSGHTPPPPDVAGGFNPLGGVLWLVWGVGGALIAVVGLIAVLSLVGVVVYVLRRRATSAATPPLDG